MQRALELARIAFGTTSPNPAVGAVIVKDGIVVGEGYTRPPGGPHAEVVALSEAGANARGSTVYCTLEPCSHQGRTPPCVDALIAAGVSKVVFAIEDPDEKVSGAGKAALEGAGIEVDVGDGAEEASQAAGGVHQAPAHRLCPSSSSNTLPRWTGASAPLRATRAG